MSVRAEDRWTRALRQIVNVLGPDCVPRCLANRCDGCHAEMVEALRIARVALGLEAEMVGSLPAETPEEPSLGGDQGLPGGDRDGSHAAPKGSPPAQEPAA